MEIVKHPHLSKIQDKLKDSINELLREIDIGRPSGIELPQCVLIDLTTAMKLYKMLGSLAEVEDVVGNPDLPCPVQSQEAVSACRNLAKCEKVVDADEMDFIK